jgi:glycosyltransferase involved in cell wall biosynthesis
MLTVFTPSFADEADSNAQNLTVKEIAARLSREKFRLVMLYENTPDPRIANLPHTRLLRWRKRGNTIPILMRLVSDVPDLYFFPREGPLDAGFFSLRRLLHLKTAVVSYVVSGGLYNSDSVRPTLARNVREADAVFANAKYLSELVQMRLGRRAGVRYDGVDRRFYFPRRESGFRERPVVLFAGSLRSYKRAPLVVRQAARLAQAEFRIAGRGEEEQECRRLANDAGCHNVKFLGHLSSRELGAQMREADIFFLPSIVEGHPQVLLQAAACGLPALAMNIYRPEYLVDGKTGFLAENDEELAAKLELLIGNVELRRVMGEAAATHAMQFDWDVITCQWEEAFAEAAARRRAK